MEATYFKNGVAKVGHKEVAFVSHVIRDRFRMYVPSDFVEDKNLVSNYTYLFSKDKSPLSIAIKYASVGGTEEREKLVTLYFNQPMDTLECINRDQGDVFYREIVTESKYLSVYSLRFAVDVSGGLLFGCFNCSAPYKDDWGAVVLAMLQQVEQF